MRISTTFATVALITAFTANGINLMTAGGTYDDLQDDIDFKTIELAEKEVSRDAMNSREFAQTILENDIVELAETNMPTGHALEKQSLVQSEASQDGC